MKDETRFSVGARGGGCRRLVSQAVECPMSIKCLIVAAVLLGGGYYAYKHRHDIARKFR